MDDSQLLNDFALSNSEEAFSDLVTRYSPLVHGVCLQRLKREDLAEDATQAVFIVLAMKARSLTREGSLSSWLCRVAHYACANAAKTEARRRNAEKEVIEMVKHRSPPQTSGVFEALERLGENDRDILLMRYYEGWTTKEICQRLRLTEAATEKRLERAVERLRETLSRQGILIPAVVVFTQMKAELPRGLVSKILAGRALGEVAGTENLIAKGVLNMIFWMQTRIVAGIVLGMGMLVGGSATIGYLAAASRKTAPAVPVAAPAEDGANSGVRIQTAYADLLRHILRLKADEQFFRSAKAHFAQAEAQEKAGQVTKLDVMRAGLLVRTSDATVLKDRRDLEAAKEVFRPLAPNGTARPLSSDFPLAMMLDNDVGVEVDEAAGKVMLIRKGDNRRSVLFQSADLNAGSVKPAIKNAMRILETLKSSILLQGRKLEFAQTVLVASRESFKRGLMDAAAVNADEDALLKYQAECIEQCLDYAVQLVAAEDLLGKNPDGLRIGDQVIRPENGPNVLELNSTSSTQAKMDF